ncbi:MAG: copper ion binding protein [Peptococcaceae bacterium]
MCDCCGGSSHVHTDVLKVDGMSCGHCKNAVEKAVGALNGVDKVEAKLEAKEVVVVYNPALVTLDAVKEAITEEGYTVH